MAQLGRPPTRPNPLDEGIAEKIAERLAGGESIRSICSDRTLPEVSMVYRAMAKNADFANTIARAREAQQDVEADRTIELADTATPENVNVVKLQIWARQWRAAKLAPKKYGDRQHVDFEGRVEQKMISDHEPTEEEFNTKFGVTVSVAPSTRSTNRTG